MQRYAADFPGETVGRCQGKWRISSETRLLPSRAPTDSEAKNEGGILQRWPVGDKAIDLGANFAPGLGTGADHFAGRLANRSQDAAQRLLPVPHGGSSA